MIRKVHAHKLVAETAEGMAHELYDTLMGDNAWYDAWKRKNYDTRSPKALEHRFIAAHLGKLVPQARAVLAGMLRTNIDEGSKQDILDALCADNELVMGRGVKYVLPKELH